jgi:O-antigen ligase
VSLLPPFGLRRSPPARLGGLSDSRWALLALSAYLVLAITRLPDILPGRGSAALTLAVAVALGIAAPPRPRALRSSLTDTKLILAFFAWSALSVPLSAWPSQSLEHMASTSLHLLAVFLLLTRSIQTPGDGVFVAWAIMISVTALAGVSLVTLTGTRLGHTYDRNDLAFIFTMGFFLLLSCFLGHRAWSRWSAAGGAAVALLAVVYTGSRAGTVTLLAVGLVGLWRHRARLGPAALLGVAVLVVLVLLLAPGSYWERIATMLPGDDPPASATDYDRGGLYVARWTIWKSAFQLLISNPLLGVGTGAFDIAEGLSHEGRGKWSAAHNAFLQVGAENGVPGLVLFVWLIARGFLNARASLRVVQQHTALRPYRWLLHGLSLSLLAYVVGGLALSQGYSVMLYALLALSAALRDVTAGLVHTLDPDPAPARLAAHVGRFRLPVSASDAERAPSPSRATSRSAPRRALVITGLITVVSAPAALHAAAPDPSARDAAIPELDAWRRNMVTFGRRHCDYLPPTGSAAGQGARRTLDEGLAHVYYDQQRVFLQIAAYTGDPSWRECADRARTVYRDHYVLPNKGRIPAYRTFTTGLRMDYEATGDPRSREAIVLLSRAAAYAPESTPLAWFLSAAKSRETAYVLLAYQDAEAVGEPSRARRGQLRDVVYKHFAQWFDGPTYKGSGQQFAPFMVALSAHTLIRDYEQTQDPRCIPTLRQAADSLWLHAWHPDSAGMSYDVNGVSGSDKPAADLNLLIAPLYGFLYRQTGDAKYRERGDALFEGGVRHAFLGSGKQFNQNYWWSFDFVRWRTR